MPEYQHYSFDLWLTLIRSNPAFKPARTAFFHHNFNYKDKPMEEVARIFRQVDLMVNAINEKTGKNIDADEMYLMVISLMNDGDIAVGDIDMPALMTEIERMLFANLPLVYSAETIEVLAHLKNNTPATINILSNTGFISGKSLRKVLAEIGLAQYFDFQLYSDETRMSKPSAAFFGLMLEHVQQLHGAVNHENIIHIGDNPVADVQGATAAGIKSMLVNSNNVSIKNLIKHASNILTT
ncbi:hypothetical protein GCM10023149_26370 [Mucilaginibacter gynuensis]|uniref:Hydrolase of the HAD superfamily n=1 Tax=Mucilaginibacter gynuensis TaxID=1302236 RepID=A0ABP8GHW9_9SPHI